MAAGSDLPATAGSVGGRGLLEIQAAVERTQPNAWSSTRCQALSWHWRRPSARTSANRCIAWSAR